MSTSSPTLPVEHIGRTAAERTARAAASTFAALAEAGASPSPDLIAVSVLTAYVSPTTPDDEAAAVVRAVLAELAS